MAERFGYLLKPLLTGLVARSRRFVAAWHSRLPNALAARPSRETGQALIEFAFLAPLIFIFLLVLVDFGLAMDRREVIQHAVHEGARKGEVGASVAEIKQHAADQSQDVLTPADITVCYVDGDDVGSTVGNAGDSVRVSAQFTYKFTVGGGEVLGALSIPAPTIDMSPSAEAVLETTVAGATPCS